MPNSTWQSFWIPAGFIAIVLVVLAAYHPAVAGAAFLALAAGVFIFYILDRLKDTRTSLENRSKEDEAMRHVVHALTGAFTLEDVLRRLTETAIFVVKAESSYVELIDADADQITCMATYGSKAPAAGTKGYYRGSLAEEVLAKLEPRIIRDVTTEGERRSIFGEVAHTCSNCAALIVPLMSDHRPFGALFLIRYHPQYFSEVDFPRVIVLADLAALAIDRALTEERTRKVEAEERFLSEAAAVLASSLDYKTTLQTVTRLAVPQMSDWCVVHLLEGERIQAVEIEHADPSKIALARELQEKYPPQLSDNGGVTRVIRLGQAEVYREITDDLLRRGARDEHHVEVLRQLNLRSAMIVPLSTGAETFGALTLATERARRYGAADLAFAKDFARHIAQAIQNARLYATIENAVRARDQVLRVVSHDLRNPVNNIQMTVKLLKNGDLTEDKRAGMLDVIGRAADRMTRLIEDLIGVARVREGQTIALNIRAENPRDIIDEACWMFSVQARTKSINLRCEASHIAPAVNADRHRVLQVLSNLLDNAIKFTAQGGQIVLSCIPQTDCVRFSVSDTGPGIAAEDLDKMFDLYWQAKPTAHLGTGLGLAIAKAIVQEHGGQIWADSTPGLGTTFLFTLPQAEDRSRALDEQRRA